MYGTANIVILLDLVIRIFTFKAKIKNKKKKKYLPHMKYNLLHEAQIHSRENTSASDLHL